MEAHALQSAGTSEQISFLLHGGQEGLSSGQLTQRLKTVRSVRSTSDLMLTERGLMWLGEAMSGLRLWCEPAREGWTDGWMDGWVNERGTNPVYCVLCTVVLQYWDMLLLSIGQVAKPKRAPGAVSPWRARTVDE